jgi:hypothetical protein
MLFYSLSNRVIAFTFVIDLLKSSKFAQDRGYGPGRGIRAKFPLGNGLGTLFDQSSRESCDTGLVVGLEMSLFASLGGGDIWSISGISFASPVNDILDRDSFTLEDLLQEEGLLQEVKSRNNRLLDFLEQRDVVQKMMNYVVIPPEAGADDLRAFKYPYMSCEVFCLEVPEILARLVENVDDRENNLLHKLFSILEQPVPLDNFLAGYFEKILDMLFRKMTAEVVDFITTGSAELVNCFLRHVENYSVLQIVQRLMLPHIPFNMAADESECAAEPKCGWSSDEVVCKLLCNRMLDETNGKQRDGEESVGSSNNENNNNAEEKSDGAASLAAYESDVPSHMSDLMITVAQISPLNAPFLNFLFRNSQLSTLFAAAFRPIPSMGEIKFASADADEALANLDTVQDMLLTAEETVATTAAAAASAVTQETEGLVTQAEVDQATTLAQESAEAAAVVAQTVAEARIKATVKNASFHSLERRLRISIAATSVLETLLSRFCESLSPHPLDGDEMTLSETDTLPPELVASTLVSIRALVAQWIPVLMVQLRSTLDTDSPPMGTAVHQCKNAFPRLGPRALQQVRLVEALTRLGDSSIDALLIAEDVFSVLLDMCELFKLNSLLHLSLQRAVLAVVDGGADRKDLQTALFSTRLVAHMTAAVRVAIGREPDAPPVVLPLEEEEEPDLTASASGAALHLDLEVGEAEINENEN